MIIAKIESQETKLFPTKTKTNFSCCFQLISPEEYIMRNFYSYRGKREKYIEQQLEKIDNFDSKNDFTPATLLMQSNMANNKKVFIVTPKFTGLSKVRNTDATATVKHVRESVEAKSSNLITKELFGSVRLDNNQTLEDEPPILQRKRKLSCDLVIRETIPIKESEIESSERESSVGVPLSGTDKNVKAKK